MCGYSLMWVFPPSIKMDISRGLSVSIWTCWNSRIPLHQQLRKMKMMLKDLQLGIVSKILMGLCQQKWSIKHVALDLKPAWFCKQKRKWLLYPYSCRLNQWLVCWFEEILISFDKIMAGSWTFVKNMDVL